MAGITWSLGLNVVSEVYVQHSMSVVHFLMVDFGWWVTILGMVVTIPGMVADRSCHFTWS